MGATTNYIILHHETWTSWKRAINLYGFPIRKRLFLFQKKEKNKTSLPTTSLFFLYSRIFSLISPSPFPSPSHLSEKDIEKIRQASLSSFRLVPSKFSYRSKCTLVPMGRSQSRCRDGSNRGRGLATCLSEILDYAEEEEEEEGRFITSTWEDSRRGT